MLHDATLASPHQTMDTELAEELNAVDSSGFGLLHYTCLYNLPTLVAVLIARGAKVPPTRYTYLPYLTLHLPLQPAHPRGRARRPRRQGTTYLPYLTLHMPLQPCPTSIPWAVILG